MLAAIEAVVTKTLDMRSGDSHKSSDLSDRSRGTRPPSGCVDSTRRQPAPPHGKKSTHSGLQSPVASGSGTKNLNLSSDEEEGFFGVDPESSGFEASDDEGCDRDDNDSILNVSAQAFQGLWIVNRMSGKRFLPIFLVSGFRVDWYPESETVFVAQHRYEVAQHLMLPRNACVTELMSRFAPQFCHSC